MTTYEPVVGLEIHAQISTNTKMFCSCSNDSFGAQPNTNVCPICMGFPGMLPVFNEQALEKGTRAALALGCEIPEYSKFDRKNYFYPDLPKGFQISQYDQPVSKNGNITIKVGGGQKTIRVNRLHLEDDAGKLVHTRDGTLCDYNRSGSPLVEIVSEPDIGSVEEASAYAQEIRKILRYVGASECDMEKGMMRFDLNISLRKKGETTLGTKAEVKNLNSFRSLERALAYEIERQTELLEKGEKIVQETRGWDDVKAETVSQRSKEGAHDYRYFPEPDLPPTIYSAERINQIKADIPELPIAKKERFLKEYGLSDEDAGILADDIATADYFEAAVKVCGDAKKVTSFMNTILLKLLNAESSSIKDCKVKPEQLGVLIKLINDGVISNNMGKVEIIEEMYKTGTDAEKVIQEKGLKLVSDTGAIEEICKKVIDENPGPVADVKSGKQAAIGFLVGKVMQASKGQANPKLVNEILRKLLGL